MARDPSDKTLDATGTLYLPSGYRGGGFVTVDFGGPNVVVEFGPAKVELLLALNRAWVDDADFEQPMRGWRSPDWITALLRYPVEEGSLRRNISRINRDFRQALPHLHAPPLLESRRSVGIRLSWPLTVLTARLPTPLSKHTEHHHPSEREA